MQGLRHLIKCRCYLPQFKRLKNPPMHQFVVFSIIDDQDNVKSKFAQCPNCGVIHKVTEISVSEILEGKEHMNSLISISEIKNSLDERIAATLETNNADVATWEEVQFIIETQDWGRYVTLNRDVDGDEAHIKVMRILGQHLFKVSNEIIEEFVKG